MTKPIRRVAVIGTGPAGAIATDALLKEQAFDEVRVFDRQDAIGGTWVYKHGREASIPSLKNLVEEQADKPVAVPSHLPCKAPASPEVDSHVLRYSDTGVHEALHSNLPPVIMSFTQEPLPEILSEQTIARYGTDAPFRSRAVVRDYVHDIFKRGGLEKLVQLNTTVERAEKEGDEWVLTLRRWAPETRINHWTVEKFDGLVVATGKYYIPYMPKVPGLLEYDQRFPGRVKHSKHYRNVDTFRGKKVIVVGGSVSAFDALHDIRVVSKGPVYASLREPLKTFGWAPFQHPDIIVKPRLKRFDAETGRITFLDDTTVDDVDIIFFATGYDFSFPFLPQEKVRNRRIQGVYQHVFDIADPSLAFIGMISRGYTFRVFEWQAVAAARLLAGRATLPSQEDMLAWERDIIAERGDGVEFPSIADDMAGYFNGLRAIAGEPALGTTGRVLPPFDPEWADSFKHLVRKRWEWWEKEARIADEKLTANGVNGAVNGVNGVVNGVNGQVNDVNGAHH
ncbi:thiol-specific monooxygenase [Coniochaeta sp. 2T2.1]|nr:thiol-specific monooxygenase [Coniochaeta sp. 2T2.1]